MQEENKKQSIEFWDRVANKWDDMSYDNNNLFNFPSSQVRHEIILSEFSKYKMKNKRILDIGCGDGKLIIALIKKGFTNVVGIDNAPKMIEEAKRQLIIEAPNINPNKIFFTADADELPKENKFDFIMAMGLIEYLKDIKDFFRTIAQLSNIGGVIFLESRNKLFNLFSANEYTLESNAKELMAGMEDIKKLSPINKDYDSLVKKIFINIGDELKKVDFSNNAKKFEIEKYPFKLPQYTPKEIMALCNLNKLKAQEFIYYHCHPFPPAYEKTMPRLFNKLGLLMQPLGYTPIGSTICSAFIAKICLFD